MKDIDKINAEYKEICTILGDIEVKLRGLDNQKSAIFERLNILDDKAKAYYANQQLEKEIQKQTIGPISSSEVLFQVCYALESKGQQMVAGIEDLAKAFVESPNGYIKYLDGVAWIYRTDYEGDSVPADAFLEMVKKEVK